jgi:GNAT superfamily N-acetyltransferase
VLLVQPGAVIEQSVRGPDRRTRPRPTGSGRAAAVWESRTPGPWNAGGIAAHLFNVCSLPGSEGRGYARACVAALVGWAREETAAGTVELAATAAGIGIYRSLGFAEPEYPVLRLALPR